ncbi:hypothetical protein J2W40_001631 [Sphingobium xenophagum]|uniref:Uncharacterized protein n=1 Tax=Sphingobium xenophagum TaxID=121428 RepID=A0ABU1X0W1_SPHXE|nr:hypothetical protein [Sphingobium xenophagum]MDR7154816.1 hypothetical protein [Sphingobium xenophagum]
MGALGSALVGTVSLIGIVSATPVSACDMHGYGFGEADILAAIDFTGMTYKDQLAAQEEALAQYEREKAAELERARASFASRFKIEHSPPQVAQK